MSIRLYDTATRGLREFVPIVPGKAAIYLCGATVQAAPHIGHVRNVVNFDILRRWLAYRGFDVTFIRNVTDVDDKVLVKAEQEGVPFWVIAQRNERAFGWAYDVLGCLPPTAEPRATGHIPEIVELIQRLVSGGHAYVADGDVYFAVRSFADYGALSGQRPAEIRASEDTGRKRDLRDFALWKGAKPGEPTWPSPWGPGRPGWHVECSAMAVKYLGREFDIHGGGLDLVFPHHENEIAQSRAAGDPFARYWLHNAWVTLSGEKMSKSLGNTLLVSEMVKRIRPIALRYYLGAPHYRSTIEYSEASLDEAVAAGERIEGFLHRAGELVGEQSPAVDVPSGFAAAMDDDLGVPQALAAVHTAVREGNAALSGADKETVAARLRDVRAMLGVLGLDPLDAQWRHGAGGRDRELRAVIDGLVALALDEREAARARRDYATADAIRSRLAAAGVVVEDTPAGPRWMISGDEL